ncbi:MAG: GreA/GreB family elongation factor [Candidatus Taylorbacteria bacterium]
MKLLFLYDDLVELQRRYSVLKKKNREAGIACGEASDQGESFAGHDNAPFEAAMLEMNISSRQLGDIELMLSKAEECIPKPNDGTVQFGRLVLIDDVSLNEKTWYLIGSPWTTINGDGLTKDDPMSTSYISPIARALSGHKVNDKVLFQNKRELRILEIC